MPEEISSAEATPDRAALNKTRPIEVHLKQLERQTKHGGLVNFPDAPLTYIYGGERIYYVGSTTIYIYIYI